MRKRTRPPARQDAIVEHIRGMIMRGKLRPGDRLPARSDVQKRFKTCAATVQRAFDRLIDAGFVSVRSRKGTFVAQRPPHLSRYVLSFPTSVTEPSWVRFWSVMESVALELERDVPCTMPAYHAVNRQREDGDFPRLLRDVSERCLAGIIFVTAPYPLWGTPVLEEPGVPRVAIMSTPPPKGVLAVDLDSHGFIDRALDFLASRGRRRIAMITVPGVDQQRLDRFAQGLAERGMTSAPHLIQAASPAEPKWAGSLAQVMLRGDGADRADGLIVTDDNLVEHACAGIIGAGRHVPEDLDVVAHCNFPAPAPSVLAVQRLGYDVRQLLRTCIDLIGRRREGRRAPALTVLPPVFESEVQPRQEADPSADAGEGVALEERASGGRTG